MDGCEDGILKTIVTVMVADVYDSHFLSNFGGSRDEGRTGPGAKCPTHRGRIKILLIFHPDPWLVKGSIFLLREVIMLSMSRGSVVEIMGGK